MKKSKVVEKIKEFINVEYHFPIKYFGIDDAEILLNYLQSSGYISPPKVKAIDIKGEEFNWGSMCHMRCSCDDCDPGFPMYVWEKE